MSLLIITVFYNRADEVNTSVSSLLDAAPINSNILLIDDGSKGKTLEELNKFSNDKRVKVISQENTGFAKTLSNVIPKYLEAYNPTYLAIHGAGDLCKKEKFSKQLKYLDENKDVVALGCGHEIISNTNGTVVGEVNGLLVTNKEKLFKNVPFTHGTVVYRVEAFKKIGGYNKLFKFCQDWEIYFRLLPFGKVVRYPEVLYSKYIFSDGASFKPTKKIEQMKYKQIVLSREISNETFEEYVQKLNSNDINDVIPNHNFKKKYKSTQLNLILKGEFELAKEWIPLITEDSNSLSQKIIKILLNFLIASKISSKIFSKTFGLLSKVKKMI